MRERLSGQLFSVVDKVESTLHKKLVEEKFVVRINEGNITRDEDLLSHFCVYFAGYDINSGKVFIGHHRKSNYWLFNGGHMDKGESPEESVLREIEEEWGDGIVIQDFLNPSFLTITDINNTNVKCKTHYDIWYFVSLEESSFNPDRNKLAKEFYETGWKTLNEAKKLIKDPNTLMAINKIEEIIMAH